ncbi:BT4734/BF3469 family protein [Spirosoma soli]|uniref:BT4734/BF3469 family protein n=1 Tax=Spirosoma soli TaxID=1770529 RepID=A0ABW5MBG2_9BACT
MVNEQHRPTPLDVPISFFEYNRSHERFANVPTQTTTLRRMATTAFYRQIVESIRLEPDEERQKELKKQLPGFTPAAWLRHRKRDTTFDERVRQQWPMLMGDVDKKDNPSVDMAELKKCISRLTYVLTCAYSVRGGLWFVVRLPDHQTPETLAAHFRYVQKLFSTYFGVILDSTKGGNPTHLRFVSYDPEPYINENATVMDKTYTPKPAAPYVPPRRSGNPALYAHEGFIDADELERQYGQAILSDLVGEALTHNGQVTRLFDTTTHSAEKFYLSGKTGKPSIHNYSENQTWFPVNAYAQKHGLTYAQALHELSQQYGLPTPTRQPVSEAHRDNRIRPPSAYIVTRLEDWEPGTILRPPESAIERLPVDPCDTYPADWEPAPNSMTSVTTWNSLFVQPPYSWDADSVRRFIQWAVIPAGCEG